MAYRDSPLSALKAPLTWIAAAVAIVVGVAALALVLTDHRGRNEGVYGAARGEFDEAMEPVTNVVSAPFRWIGAGGNYIGGYFFAMHENQVLHKQVQELQRWRDARRGAEEPQPALRSPAEAAHRTADQHGHGQGGRRCARSHFPTPASPTPALWLG